MWRLLIGGFVAIGIFAAVYVIRDRPPDMLWIPAGEFLIGSDDGDADKKPAHRIYLDGFYIDTYEVTNALYGKFLRATGRSAPALWTDAKYNAPDQPVVGVTWHDAEAYCRWAAKRLPTAMERNKAARGTDGRTYPWGNQWDNSRANTADGGPGRPTPVGSYEGDKSPYGAYDMAGNVSEWVADWYGANYYKTTRNPKGPMSGSGKIMLGGSWLSEPRDVRADIGGADNPSFRNVNLGFRCAKTP